MIFNFTTQLPKGYAYRETKFIESLQSKYKATTIRAGFRLRDGVEYDANIYTGIRTKASKHHMDIPIQEFRDCVIWFGGVEPKMEDMKIVVGGVLVKQVRAVAFADGFILESDFRKWFWDVTMKGWGAFVGQMVVFHKTDRTAFSGDMRSPKVEAAGKVVGMGKTLYATKEGRQLLKTDGISYRFRSFLEYYPDLVGDFDEYMRGMVIGA